jgi:hypothetical protein
MQNCSEAYVDGKITDRLLKMAEESARSGILVAMREYNPA